MIDEAHDVMVHEQRVDLYCGRLDSPAAVWLVLNDGPRERVAPLARAAAERGMVLIVPEWSSDLAKRLDALSTEIPKNPASACLKDALRVTSVLAIGGAAELATTQLCHEAHDASPRWLLAAPKLARRTHPALACSQGLEIAIAEGCERDLADTIDGVFDRIHVDLFWVRGLPACDALPEARFRDVVVQLMMNGQTTGDVRYEAHTAAKAESATQLNISLLLGGGAIRANDETRPGFTWGLRPELVFGRRSPRSWGVGPYAEIGSPAHGFLVGGGGTVFVPLGDRHAFAPSIGVQTLALDGTRSYGGTFGFFIGSRMFNDISMFDGSFGLRVDARTGFRRDDPRSITVALQIDLIGVAALGAF